MLESLKNAYSKLQAEYRKRHIKEGSDQRHKVILGLDAKLAFDPRAKHCGVTNKELLERASIFNRTQVAILGFHTAA